MTPKTKFVFIVAAAYLVGAVLAFGFVVTSVNRLGDSLINNVQVIADQYAREQKYTELSELAANTEAERMQLQRYLLSEKDTISFLADIESVGAEQGLSFNTNSLQVIDHPNAENKLEVKFGMAGTENQVLRMLNILETLPYDSELTGLSLTRGDTETKLDVTMHVTLYQ